MDMPPDSISPRWGCMDSTEQAFLGGPLTSLLDSLPAGVLYCRRVEAAGAPSDFLCLHANPALLQMTGQSSIAGQLFSALWPQPAGAQPALRDSFCQIVQGAAPQTLEVFASGSGQWFSVFAWAPDSGHLVAFFEIITRHKQVELALHERATQLQFVLEGSELGFWDWNIATGEVDRNAQWAHMLGYTHEEMQHTTQQWSDFVHPQDRDRAWASILAVVEGHATTHKIEYRMLHKDGSVRWILDQAKVMQRAADGSALRMCGTHTDITERKLLEEELLRQAHIDYLTGVSNRRHFMECAEHELQRASRYDQPLSLLMLDIDHFKRINDQHGHKAGDAALVAIAALCRATLRGCDILGRFGGEEFAVLLPETALAEALQVAERLRAEIAALQVGLPARITASIGVATLTAGSDGIDALLSQADAALYEAKDAGRNRVCCPAAG